MRWTCITMWASGMLPLWNLNCKQSDENGWSCPDRMRVLILLEDESYWLIGLYKILLKASFWSCEYSHILEINCLFFYLHLPELAPVVHSLGKLFKSQLCQLFGEVSLTILYNIGSSFNSQMLFLNI